MLLLLLDSEVRDGEWIWSDFGVLSRGPSLDRMSAPGSLAWTGLRGSAERGRRRGERLGLGGATVGMCVLLVIARTGILIVFQNAIWLRTIVGLGEHSFPGDPYTP